MSEFMREVDEEYRRDRAIEAWKKYQTPLIALAVLIVLGTGGWRAWQSWTNKQAEEAGAKYESALQLARDGKSEEAEKALVTLAGDNSTGYALLARFRAAAELGARDKAAAVKAFDAIAADGKVAQVLQEAARLRAATLRLDDADANEIRQRLEPMAAAGRPFRNSARELLAFAALKSNDLEGAGKWLDLIVTDATAPPQIKGRAELLQGLVSSGAAPKK